MSTTDDLLLAHALGALDPGDVMALGDDLGADPRARFRLSGLGFLADARPAHHAPQDVALSVGAAPVLSADGRYRIGERATVRLTPPVPPGEIRPVLWRAAGADVTRLFPRAGRWPTLDQLRFDGEVCLLDLVLTGPPGPQTFTLVLVPADLFPTPWPEGDPRWTAMGDAFTRGDLPGATFTLEVEAPT